MILYDLIKVILICCLAAILLLEIIRFFYRRTKKYREIHRQAENLIGRIPNGLRIVAIGSGPGKNGISFQ